MLLINHVEGYIYCSFVTFKAAKKDKWMKPRLAKEAATSRQNSAECTVCGYTSSGFSEVVLLWQTVSASEASTSSFFPIKKITGGWSSTFGFCGLIIWTGLPHEFCLASSALPDSTSGSLPVPAEEARDWSWGTCIQSGDSATALQPLAGLFTLSISCLCSKHFISWLLCR